MMCAGWNGIVLTEAARTALVGGNLPPGPSDVAVGDVAPRESR
ncbi:hypothetical protein [Streptomyces sp. JJ36]|nr:hypothetical protein [Streptomyces sp. JJ36]